MERRGVDRRTGGERRRDLRRRRWFERVWLLAVSLLWVYAMVNLQGEKTSVRTTRDSNTRICARADLDRAEIQLAYQTAPLTIPKSVQKTEPALAGLLVITSGQRQVNLGRVHYTLPILDCTPNIRGARAVPFSPKRQAQLVEAYRKCKLDPTPSVDDARSIKDGGVGHLEPQDMPLQRKCREALAGRQP